MAITAEAPNRVATVGSGTTGPFTTPQYIAAADLLVIRTVIATGAETTLTLNALTDGYTVDTGGSGSAGTITTSEAVAATDQITVINDPSITQNLTLSDNVRFPAGSINDALDRLTFLARRLDDRIGRSVELADSVATPSSQISLPALVADYVPSVNSAATGFEFTVTVSEISSAAANATAAASSASAASSSASAASASATTASTASGNAATAQTAAEAAQTAAEAARDAMGFRYAFDAVTTKADPGAANFRFNSGSLGAITELYIDDAPATGGDLGSVIAGWDDVANADVRGWLYLKGVDDTSDFSVFEVVGSVTDETGYWTVPVDYVGGALPTDTEAYLILFVPAGADGVDGADGAPGAGSGDMLASTYDAASISEQLVGLTATQTLTNKTLTSPTINTPTFSAGAIAAGSYAAGSIDNDDINASAAIAYSKLATTGGEGVLGAASDAAPGLIAKASQAEMEAGTVTALRAMTPEGVKQAIDALASGGGVNTVSTSTFTATAGASGAVTHGQSSNPIAAVLLLECTTADLSYAVGDVEIVPAVYDGFGIAIWYNATQIEYKVSNNGIRLLDASSGNGNGINTASWDATVVGIFAT